MKALSTKLAVALFATLIFTKNALASNHNLTSDTIQSLFGLQNLEYSYKIFEHWTFGITVASTSRHITNNNIQLKGNSYGTVVRYYIDPALQNNTWYLAGAFTKTNFEATVTSEDTRYTGKSDDMVALSAGYHWFWKSFNIALGGVFTNPSKIELKDSLGNKYHNKFNTNIGLELKIGGKF